MELYKLDNVEIFRTGKWHGKPFTEKELDEMVDNFNRFSGSWFKPAIKKGHSNKVGAVALGSVNKLWRSGKTLIANLIELPKAVYNAIKAHGYDQVSIELVPEIERGGKIYKNVLWALSLLGAEVPEVDGLAPLRESLSSDVNVVNLATFLSIDGEVYSHWTDEHINKLPDAAFTAVEKWVNVNDKGKTAKTRHLPHHTSAVKHKDENETVDKLHLLNALYRLESVNVQDEDAARAHLESHAKALGIEIPTTQEVNTMTDEEKKKFEAEKKKLEAKNKEQADNILKLAADFAKATEEIKKLSAKDPKDGNSTKEIEALQAKAKEADAEIVKLQATNRTARIDAKLKEVRIPAMVPFIKEFYELAAGKTETIKFSTDGKDPKDTTHEQIVDQFVAYMNKATETLFAATGIHESLERDDVPADENIRIEVDNKVKAYQTEHKDTDYDVAIAAVFAADPKLKEAYAAS